MYRISTLLFVWTAAALLTPTASLADAEAALGSDGTLYRVHTVPPVQIVPDSQDRDPAIILETVAAASDERSWSIVPESQGSATEASRVLIHDSRSQLLHLIWEAEGDSNADHSLHLSSFDGDSWSEVVDLDASALALSDGPTATMTRDAFFIRLEGNDPITVHRTILHLLWSEAGQDGEPSSTVYTPVVFVDGRYVGWNPRIVLDDFDQAEAPSQPRELAPQLFSSPTLSRGRDHRSVIATFANPQTQRLTSFEIEVVPLEISHFGDAIMAQIISMGSIYEPGEVAALADAIMAQIISMGSTYNPAFVGFLAGAAQSFVLEQGEVPANLDELASQVRDLTIDLGASLITDELGQTVAGASTILEIDLSGLSDGNPSAGGQGPEAQFLDLHPVASWPAPTTGSRDLQLITSPRGHRSAVSWLNGDGSALLYRESVEDGWTSTRKLALDETLSAQQARELLRQRLED